MVGFWPYVASPEPRPIPTGPVIVAPPQEIADELALAAQYYAGSLVGHPFRSARFGEPNTSRVDVAREWREKAIVPDDCIFCEHMTDEDIIRRINGYQYQLDIEVMRGPKNVYYTLWLNANIGVPEPGEIHSRRNRRQFIEAYQNVKTAERPSGWKERPFPLVSLSMRHQRKLCCTWNHILLKWMEENGLHYDFEKRQFVRPAPPAPVDSTDSDA